MPKLNKSQAKQVEAAQEMSGGFLLDSGRYAAQLRSVTELPGDQFPYWSWEFHNIHDTDGNKHPGRQWNTTSLSPKSAGFLKAAFAAFGYSSDSDTDEMLNEWVVLYLEQEVQKQGKNAGQLRNKVTRLAAFDPDEWDFDVDQESITASADDDSTAGGSDDF